MPGECDGSTQRFERCRAGSTPALGTSRECDGRTRPCEGLRVGSIPAREIPIGQMVRHRTLNSEAKVRFLHRARQVGQWCQAASKAVARDGYGVRFSGLPLRRRNGSDPNGEETGCYPVAPRALQVRFLSLPLQSFLPLGGKSRSTNASEV